MHLIYFQINVHCTYLLTSAAELAAGDFLRPHLPSAHREDRPRLADPSLPSGPRGELPFVDGDRRRPATVRAERKEGEGDQSNLTSGPPGLTVSDPRAVHSG